MVASAARLEANRRNARKSTGPRTEGGKERSRANALKHGLTAVVLRTPEDEKAAEEWARRCPEATGSTALDAAWLAEEISVIMGRIERIAKIDARNRERAVLRAETTWYDDRRREAESLGSALSRRPSEIVRLLEGTPQGCDWLAGRWAMLARVADLEHGWDEPARALAFDLLGTPRELRKGTPGQRIDPDGRLLEEPGDFAAVARGQIERLKALRDEVAHIDEFDRESALMGLSGDSDLVDRRLRRYESALHARLRWYLEKLDEGAGPPSVQAVEPAPAPSMIPGPTEEPEFEPDVAPAREIPAPPLSRREKKARKVQGRRAAAERKLARRLG